MKLNASLSAIQSNEGMQSNDLLVVRSPNDLAQLSSARLVGEVSSGRVTISCLSASQEGSNACAGITVYTAFARSRLHKLSNELIEYASTNMGRNMHKEVCLGQNLKPDSLITFAHLVNMIPHNVKQQEEIEGNIYDRNDRQVLLHKLQGSEGVGIGECTKVRVVLDSPNFVW